MSYPRPWGTLETHYSPFRHSTRGASPTFAFDLHVLAMPPAFNLSQDQTLQLVYFRHAEPTVRSARRDGVNKRVWIRHPDLCDKAGTGLGPTAEAASPSRRYTYRQGASHPCDRRAIAQRPHQRE